MKKKIRATVAIFLILLTVLALPVPTTAVNTKELIAAGIPFGVKFHTEGLIVVGIPGGKGPAAEAGLQRGDIITALDGIPMRSAEEFAQAVKNSGGSPLAVDFISGNRSHTVQMTPKSDESGEYKLGIWVKDSAAGIGTVTFIDPKTMTFAGLGHGICDASSGELLPLAFGSAEEVMLTGIIAGKPGTPGELRGSFAGRKIGKLLKNDLTGIYGILVEIPQEVAEQMYPIAKIKDVKEGKATIFSTVDDEGRKDYEIEIYDIVKDGKDRNFSIRVTDEALLQKTGGIVQGMSGSPIIQNGKIIGAVTHVLVNDPTRGYGIFIENMLNAAQMPMAKAS